MGNFVHLHLHSEYSLLDGAVRLTHQVFKNDDEGKLKSVTAYPLVMSIAEVEGIASIIFRASL